MSRDAAPRSVALIGVQTAFDFIDVGTRKWNNESEVLLCMLKSSKSMGKKWIAGHQVSLFAALQRLDGGHSAGNITSMALSRKKATTIALDPEDDRLLSRAARERGVSRSEFIRQHLALVLEQYRRHPKPRSAGTVRALAERGNERELFRAGR